MVSVIVPVYNVEKYLEKCLDSIVNQTLKDIEIILIDDGSKDNSGVICDNYAKEDNRIKVVHQENQGVSIARNKGLEIANGEYITFVDSDDYIEQEMLEEMYSKALKEKVDCVVCEFKKVYKDKIVNFDYKIGYNKLLVKDEINNYIRNFRNLVYFGATWCKLIDRNIIEKNNIKFMPKVNISEDSLFMLEMLLNVNNLYVIDKPFYNYIIREDTLTTKKYRSNLINSYNQVYLKAFKLYKENKIDDFYPYFLDVCANRILIVLRQEKYNQISKSEKIKLLKIIRHTEMVRDVFKYKRITSFFTSDFLDKKIFINRLKNIHIMFLLIKDYINVFLLKYKKYNLLANRLK